MVLTTDAPPNGVGKDGDGFTGLPVSSDESIGASSNVFCPANHPLRPAAQMAERESRAQRLQAAITRRRGVFTAFTGQQKHRSPPLHIWVKCVVPRRVMRQSDVALNGRSR